MNTLSENISLNPHDKSRLNVLRKKIDQNEATVDDFREYEHLLLAGGFSREQIWQGLHNQGIYTWEEYLQRRELAKSYQERSALEAIIKGGLLGLGLIILLDTLFGKK